MKSKSLTFGLGKSNLAFLGLLGIFLALVPEMGWALKVDAVVDNVNTVSSDIVSVIKADGIKILTLVLAWASVALFALFHKPVGKAALGAAIVTGVVIFIHKWA